MNTYLLFKSIHLIAVISWMAGLLYLPRIFVYHSEAVQNNKSEDLMETFKVMERRLLVYIMNPAMIVSWIFGVLLFHTIGMDNFGSIWLQLKLAFVIILTICKTCFPGPGLDLSIAEGVTLQLLVFPYSPESLNFLNPVDISSLDFIFLSTSLTSAKPLLQNSKPKTKIIKSFFI